jgi:hypothetical protein
MGFASLYPSFALAKNWYDLSTVARTTWMTPNNPSNGLAKYGTPDDPHQTLKSQADVLN